MQNARANASRIRLHGSTRHYHLKQRYGIGAAEVEQILESQGWSCPICSTPLTLKNAHVDHDHATGSVRGVLCFNCNGGLGQFRDDTRALIRAVAYLRSGIARSAAPAKDDVDLQPNVRAVLDRNPPSRLHLLLSARLAASDFGTAS
jgi:hypothetical protein